MTQTTQKNQIFKQEKEASKVFKDSWIFTFRAATKNCRRQVKTSDILLEGVVAKNCIPQKWITVPDKRVKKIQKVVSEARKLVNQYGHKFQAFRGAVIVNSDSIKKLEEELPKLEKKYYEAVDEMLQAYELDKTSRCAKVRKDTKERLKELHDETGAYMPVNDLVDKVMNAFRAAYPSKAELANSYYIEWYAHVASFPVGGDVVETRIAQEQRDRMAKILLEARQKANAQVFLDLVDQVRQFRDKLARNPDLMNEYNFEKFKETLEVTKTKSLGSLKESNDPEVQKFWEYVDKFQSMVEDKTADDYDTQKARHKFYTELNSFMGNTMDMQEEATEVLKTSMATRSSGVRRL